MVYPQILEYNYAVDDIVRYSLGVFLNAPIAHPEERNDACLPAGRKDPYDIDRCSQGCIS